MCFNFPKFYFWTNNGKGVKSALDSPLITYPFNKALSGHLRQAPDYFCRSTQVQSLFIRHRYMLPLSLGSLPAAFTKFLFIRFHPALQLFQILFRRKFFRLYAAFSKHPSYIPIIFDMLTCYSRFSL